MVSNSNERQIRPIALGRKNYLFAGSHEGARRAATLYSLINPCKMHGVNAFDYIRELLIQVQLHPAIKVRELLPDLWKEKFS